MPFEVFDKRAAPRTDKPWVTMQRAGNFSLNEVAYRELGKPTDVELLYDRETQRIAIRPISEPSQRSFQLRQQRPKGGGTGTYLVAGQAFATYYGLDTATAKRFTPEFKDGMLILDLNSEYADASGVRGRNRTD